MSTHPFLVRNWKTNCVCTGQSRARLHGQMVSTCDVTVAVIAGFLEIDMMVNWKVVRQFFLSLSMSHCEVILGEPWLRCTQCAVEVVKLSSESPYIRRAKTYWSIPTRTRPWGTRAAVLRRAQRAWRLWLFGSLKLYVSFAEYRLIYRALSQKRPIISGASGHVGICGYGMETISRLLKL